MIHVDVPGATLAVKVSGPERASAVTLAHAIMTDHTLWDDLADDLAESYRVVRYDCRGHGASTARDEDFGLDDLAQDTVRIWDALGIAKSAFVGLSLGAMTGLGLAIDHAERMTCAALCDLRADAPAAFAAPWDERVATARREGVMAVGEPMIGRWLVPATFERAPKIVEHLRRMVAGTSIAGYAGAAGALKRLDYLPRVQRINVPTLFVVGSEDHLFRKPTQELAGLVPGAGFVEIGGAGHAPNLEQPEAFGRAVSEFLAAKLG